MLLFHVFISYENMKRQEEKLEQQLLQEDEQTPICSSHTSGQSGQMIFSRFGHGWKACVRVNVGVKAA